MFAEFFVLLCSSYLEHFLIVVSFQTQVNPAAEGLFRGKQAFLGLNVLKMIDS